LANSKVPGYLPTEVARHFEGTLRKKASEAMRAKKKQAKQCERNSEKAMRKQAKQK